MTIWIKLWCHSDYSYNQSNVEAINSHKHPSVAVGYQVQVVASCEISLNRRFDEILPHHCHYVIGYSLTQGVTCTLCTSTNVMHTYCTGQQLPSNVLQKLFFWRLPDSKNLLCLHLCNTKESDRKDIRRERRERKRGKWRKNVNLSPQHIRCAISRCVYMKPWSHG